ncbi:MAG: UrcA family protein, partial [Alphaproteobacteria bacterium]|nr:UrcA family protein [Alphaproteobacteria bacterium]
PAFAPAFAQETTVQSVTVMGRYMPRGEPPVQLSRVVDYSDLDLRMRADQDELRHRIVRAADDVCDRLGRAAPNHTNMGTSCREQAVRDAMNQVGMAVAQAYARPAPAYAYVEPVPAEAYPAAPPPPDGNPQAPAAGGYGEPASATVTTQTITNGPVPDTAANRARYGGPMSNAGRKSKPIGN